MLIKFRVLDGDDRVDEIARKLIVWNGLAVLDVDLSEDLIISIKNHTRRFHLFELVQIETPRLTFEVRGDH